MARHAQSVHEAQAHLGRRADRRQGAAHRAARAASSRTPPLTWNARTGRDTVADHAGRAAGRRARGVLRDGVVLRAAGPQDAAAQPRRDGGGGFDPKVGGGFEVSFSELPVKGDVPGITDEDFRRR